ncbi:winged helix-turn-helix domain-containing protein [Halorarius litoreus]|uniref:winged helix-turn-helix domain-containing protein n=1 Tax=Halorarius litoreus TaxID=2962676 RepID=UPI0020CFC6D4|nr:helix-turn-helix domain-containing protein [Halorarius litoreus]
MSFQSTTTRPGSPASQSQPDVSTVLDALDDERCREILAVVGDEPLSAAEIHEAADLPRSTTYRKLELLAEAGLVSETLDIRQSGHHVAQYRRACDNIVVGWGETGLVANLVATDGGTDDAPRGRR